VAITFLALGLHHSGRAFMLTNPGFSYNRYGYCLVALVFLESLLEREKSSPRMEFLAGVSSGVCVASLFFMKITSFALAGLVILLLIPARRQTFARWAGLASGFLASFGVFWAYLGYTLAPMIENLRVVGGARRREWEWFHVEAQYYSLAPLLFFAAAAAWLAWAERASLRARRIVLAGIATAICGDFFLWSNYQGSLMPLNAIGVIAILHLLNQDPAPPSGRTARIALLMWGAWFLAISIGTDVGSLGSGLVNKRLAERPSVAQFEAPRLAGFSSLEVTPAEVAIPLNYVHMLNDGVRLLQQHRRPEETVISVDFSNAFSFTLGIRPPVGGVEGLHYGMGFDERHHLSGERLFGNANLVMWPKRFSGGNLSEIVPKLYGPYVANHFSLVAESPRWRLYRRNQ
jgi:hypothetical protein